MGLNYVLLSSKGLSAGRCEREDFLYLQYGSIRQSELPTALEKKACIHLVPIDSPDQPLPQPRSTQRDHDCIESVGKFARNEGDKSR